LENFSQKGGVFLSITGIICEYNPLHLGHAKQLSHIRQSDPDGGIVCLMSGNYVQRGMPAIFDKSFRAAAAIDCGADLVLELPVTAALSSAEGFAAEGVRILGAFCDQISFGAEDPDPDKLIKAAEVLLSPVFSLHLKKELSEGLSFPAARQNAVEKLGMDGALLAKPNNILAVEYCKAILSQNSKMKPIPIGRPGDYNSTVPNPDDPSATAVRQCIADGKNWLSYIPSPAQKRFQNAPVHSLTYGQRAVLGRLWTMTDSEYETLPYGSEGLWRKLMKNARQLATIEEILTATKSKRYTRTRLDRMVMCAFLGHYSG
jgi:predicted nucleotidyltransferase